MIFVFVALLAAAVVSAPPSLDGVVSGAAANGFAGEVLVTDAHAVRYGRAVSAPGRPHRRGDVWRWASVTKQVTATLVMQQVAAGTLSLDDTLARRLPEFSGPTGTRVTVRMLLQHTSGLPNPDDTPTADAASVPAFYLRGGATVGGVADALGFCAGKPKAEPGAGFSYNNCDFIVLGALLERVTGSTYADLLRTHIVEPAGLRTLHMASAADANNTPGFAENGTPEPHIELATFGPAGAALRTSDDLARFDRALLDDRLLPAPERTIAWTGNPKLGYVALGVWSFPARLTGCDGTVDLVERRGEIGGIEVRNLIAPNVGRALIVFADRAGLDFGEIWQGKGLSYDLASAAFCSTDSRGA